MLLRLYFTKLSISLENSKFSPRLVSVSFCAIATRETDTLSSFTLTRFKGTRVESARATSKRIVSSLNVNRPRRSTQNEATKRFECVPTAAFRKVLAGFVLVSHPLPPSSDQSIVYNDVSPVGTSFFRLARNEIIRIKVRVLAFVYHFDLTTEEANVFIFNVHDID